MAHLSVLSLATSFAISYFQPERVRRRRIMTQSRILKSFKAHNKQESPSKAHWVNAGHVHGHRPHPNLNLAHTQLERMCQSFLRSHLQPVRSPVLVRHDAMWSVENPFFSTRRNSSRTCSAALPSFLDARPALTASQPMTFRAVASSGVCWPNSPADMFCCCCGRTI